MARSRYRATFGPVNRVLKPADAWNRPYRPHCPVAVRCEVDDVLLGHLRVDGRLHVPGRPAIVSDEEMGPIPGVPGLGATEAQVPGGGEDAWRRAFKGDIAHQVPGRS